LVRMRSAVRICLAAPKALNLNGFRAFSYFLPGIVLNGVGMVTRW